MFTLIWLTVLFLVLVQYLWTVYSRFSNYGVNTIKPLPILGNIAPLTIRLRHVAEDFQLLYKTFPEDRFVGRYDLLRPTVIVRDLDLMKKITIKDFEHFLDHRVIVDDTIDPMFGRNLFSLKGQEWKDMRSTLSPAFTSSKMKSMVPFMVEANKCMINSLQKRIGASENGFIDVDCKDLTTRYATDVIGSCAFGIKVDSHEEGKNDFYINGRNTATFGFRLVLVYLGYASFPGLMKKLNVKLLSDQTSQFFKSLVLSTMKERELRNIFRPDMIQLLMEAKKGKLTYDEQSAEEADTGFATVEESDIGKNTVNRVWSDIDLVAQATLFFIAGFETVSSTMSFLLHELAVNPDVQEKLAREIKENDAKTNGKFDYGSIQNLKYLDMVVSELLRLWPPVVGLDRLCVKDYNLGKPHAKAKNDFILKKGEGLSIPVWSLHHDPNYFPKPYKFDPERFSDENKHKIIPFTYQPFGSGPRNCIGSRFALCEVKVMVYQLLQEMEVTVCEKTPIPAKLATDTFNIRIAGGHWIRLKTRQ